LGEVKPPQALEMADMPIELLGMKELPVEV